MPYRLAVCINLGLRKIDIELRKSKAFDKCFGICSGRHYVSLWGFLSSQRKVKVENCQGAKLGGHLLPPKDVISEDLLAD